MAECGKLSALIIGLGLAPHEGFEIVFLQQAAGKLYGHARASIDVRLDNKRIFPQDAQKGQTSHPPNPGAPRRTLSHARPQLRSLPSFYVSHLTFHSSWERSENDAGGLFQQPAKVPCAKDQRQKLAQRGNK
jgi:hypothetical protein